jgi:hypothetical protein
VHAQRSVLQGLRIGLLKYSAHAGGVVTITSRSLRFGSADLVVAAVGLGSGP